MAVRLALLPVEALHVVLPRLVEIDRAVVHERPRREHVDLADHPRSGAGEPVRVGDHAAPPARAQPPPRGPAPRRSPSPLPCGRPPWTPAVPMSTTFSWSAARSDTSDAGK